MVNHVFFLYDGRTVAADEIRNNLFGPCLQFLVGYKGFQIIQPFSHTYSFSVTEGAWAVACRTVCTHPTM